MRTQSLDTLQCETDSTDAIHYPQCAPITPDGDGEAGTEMDSALLSGCSGNGLSPISRGGTFAFCEIVYPAGLSFK